MSDLEPRTVEAVLAGLPAEERRELIELAAADRRMTSVEHQIERLERHLAGNCLDDCPCKPRAECGHPGRDWRLQHHGSYARGWKAEP